MKVLRLEDDDYLMVIQALQGHPELLRRILIKKAKRAPAACRQFKLEGADLEYFMAAWRGWPTEVKGKWVPGQGFEKKTVLKGSRKEAAENFTNLLVDGHANARELYAASVAYLLESPAVKEGFVQNVATFYGPKKATVLEWLDRAKEMIAEQDRMEGVAFGEEHER
jgi:hypothetical protein